ncbi:hypothetical protein [Microvenator marinus]|jgi:hypothetical protein|uniref:hypothetical protein n=1 Tax=Microvenator marinus TaxID=2600177 RepID=UPI00201B5A0B|nr:hypothetical protein [Microvenator marinus]
MEEHKFDIRTLERKLDQNLITKEEYDKYLKSLEDAEDQSTKIEAKFEKGVYNKAK